MMTLILIVVLDVHLGNTYGSGLKLQPFPVLWIKQFCEVGSSIHLRPKRSKGTDLSIGGHGSTNRDCSYT